MRTFASPSVSPYKYIWNLEALAEGFWWFAELCGIPDSCPELPLRFTGLGAPAPQHEHL